MMRFIEWPWALPLVLLLPLAVWLLLGVERRSRMKRLARLGTREMLARLAPRTTRRGVWRTVRLSTVALLFGLAFAGPRWGMQQRLVQSDGVDVVLALDASLSMTATDEQPSRLAKMRQVVRQLRAMSPNDRFALIAFAGRSYILTPLTTDDGAIGLYLDNLDPSVVGQAGSAFSTAIQQGTSLLSLNQGGGDRAIVLMSDGETFESVDDVRAAAKRAADAGIELVTVGFGTTGGATIPVRTGNTTTEKRDESGQVVVTRYTPEMLRTAAEEAGGVFVPAEATDKAALVRRVIDGLKTSPRSMSTGSDLSPQFIWFLAPALLLLALDTLLSIRSRRRAVTTAAAAATAVLAACAPHGDAARVTQYNQGTALLARDSLTRAIVPLDSAAETADSTLRYRSTFNGGLAYLIQGRRLHGDSASAPLTDALAHYRLTLLRAPDDADAKWNYELALVDKKKGGGGGGGGGNSGQPEPKPQPTPSAAIGLAQAEALLDNAEREERDVQGNKQRRNVPQPPPQGKDW